MAYYILDAVKMIEKSFAYVLEIAFVMSFVLILILAVRFLVRKRPKSLSYGLWSVAGIGFLYAGLPPLHLQPPYLPAVRFRMGQGKSTRCFPMAFPFCLFFLSCGR